MMVCTCGPSYTGGLDRRIIIGDQCQAKKLYIILKIKKPKKKKKKTRGLAQVIDYLPRKALSSSPSTTKKKKICFRQVILLPHHSVFLIYNIMP
jgi:hypothetical protein